MICCKVPKFDALKHSHIGLVQLMKGYHWGAHLKALGQASFGLASIGELRNDSYMKNQILLSNIHPSCDRSDIKKCLRFSQVTKSVAIKFYSEGNQL